MIIKINYLYTIYHLFEIYELTLLHEFNFYLY